MLADAAAWVSAIGTIAAVVVALLLAVFGPRLSRRYWSPRVDSKSDVSVFPVKIARTGHYVRHGYGRLLVEITAGPAAEDLQAYLVSCEPAAWLDKRQDLPLRRFQLPLRWSFTHEAAVTLAPGLGRFLDLLEIVDGEQRWARLMTNPQPPEGHYLVESDRSYELVVELASRNMRAARWTVSVTHRGGWDGSYDNLREVLTVAPSRSQP